MWQQFFLENLQFVSNFFAALVVFAVFWLYWDAWLEKKPRRELFKLIGLVVLALSFVFNAAYVEASVFGVSYIPVNLHAWGLSGLRIVGYVFLVIGLYLEPLQTKPDTRGVTREEWFEGEEAVVSEDEKVELKETTQKKSTKSSSSSKTLDTKKKFLSKKKSAKSKSKAASIFVLPAKLTSLTVFSFVTLSYPFVALLAGLLYLRRATIGLERHLRGVAAAFLILSLSEFASLGRLLRGTENVDLFNFVKPFGLLWIVEYSLLIIAMIILGRWVWQYLLQRFQSQIFMLFTAVTLVIFSLVTASFTTLLLRNVQNETLSQLQTDVKVLNFAIESQRAGLSSDAEVVSVNDSVKQALRDNQYDSVKDLVQTVLVRKELSSLLILDNSGQVVVNAANWEKTAYSLSEDTLVRRALLGQSIESVVVEEGVLAPEIYVKTALPVKNGDTVIGVVMLGELLDNAFVDRIKTTTGLETAMYGGSTLSATTLIGEDGKSRWVGIEESDQKVKQTVLDEGQIYAGAKDLLNVPYLAAYAPLKDVDDVTVGMLFVGKLQQYVLQAAGRSIQATFIIAAVLILLMVYPSYKIARYISYQLN